MESEAESEQVYQMKVFIYIYLFIFSYVPLYSLLSWAGWSWWYWNQIKLSKNSPRINARVWVRAREDWTHRHASIGGVPSIVERRTMIGQKGGHLSHIPYVPHTWVHSWGWNELCWVNLLCLWVWVVLETWRREILVHHRTRGHMKLCVLSRTRSLLCWWFILVLLSVSHRRIRRNGG